MTVEYSYNFNEFPNNSVNVEKLTREIVESVEIFHTLNSIYTVDGQKAYIVFETSPLSPSEEAALDAIVAAHDGTPYDKFDPIYVESLTESETTSQEWQDKLILEITGNPAPGTYRLDWTLRFGNSPANRQIEARLYDTTADMEIETVIHQQPGTDVRAVYTSFCMCTLDGPKTIIMQYRVTSTTGNPIAFISKARMLFGELT